ncbi:MAG: xanthine dehydrogenase family protein molybdopterin-binding subunit, partial [Pseudomonadales bacterium]|nr:xanthine dehydrogenase family protein molybdopterin-binding subunit [Pseudomonadales bacterium]
MLEATYEVPYLAHATMEPQNSTARFTDDGICEIWSPNQGPDVVQALVAEALDMPRSKIVVHTTLLGGGFGRRGIPDFAVDAAEIARQVEKPVKVIWSREEDTQHDYYRPATWNVMKAGLDQHGVVQTWQHKLVAPSMTHSLLPKFGTLAPEWMPDWLVNALIGGAGAWIKTRDSSTVEGAEQLPYRIPNIDIRHVYYDPGVPLGFWRSVGHSQNAFITESFIDELAHKAGTDPCEFRRRLLGDNHPRHLAVLDLVAGKSNWGKAGVSQGIAVHESFGSVVAEVVDITVVNGKPRIERITCAV